jgi:hypothetical protein
MKMSTDWPVMGMFCQLSDSKQDKQIGPNICIGACSIASTATYRQVSGPMMCPVIELETTMLSSCISAGLSLTLMHLLQ